jgi:hypothetical protein
MCSTTPGRSFRKLLGLVAFVVPSAVASLAAGSDQTLYALQRAPLYADSVHGRRIGVVMPGAAVKAAGAAGAERQVTFDGWSQRGNAGTVVSAPGVRIVVAELDADAPTHAIGSTHDPYGNTWTHVVVSGAVRANALTADRDVVWSNAKALYSKRCSACHALHKPTEFTANQWPTILKTMTKNAALQPEQAALVTQYLQAHAR